VAALIGAATFGVLTFDKKIDLAFLVAAFGFLITIVQLNQSTALQRGTFIKDHVAQFFARPELYETWHDLVYNYENDLFAKVDEYVARNKLRGMPQRPIQLTLDQIDLTSEERIKWNGIRIYHPDIFQGSDEEKKLDGLLGYLDVIGFHCESGLIGVADVSGSLGYFLSHMGRRRIIMYYLDLTKDLWQGPNSKYREITPEPPFDYTRKLLDRLARFNQRRMASPPPPVVGLPP